jgi:hypothetical protein
MGMDKGDYVASIMAMDRRVCINNIRACVKGDFWQ